MVVVHIGPDNLPVLHQKGGAIERRMLGIAGSQSRMGDKVIVYSIGTERESHHYNGYEIRSIPCTLTKIARHIFFQARCIADLKGEQVDIIHFHSQPEGAYLSKSVKARKYLTYDYFEFRRGKRSPLHPIYPYLLRQFDCLLPVSQYCLAESSSYWAFSGMKTRVVYNGVDIRQFHPDPISGMEFKTTLGLNKKVILYVGRVCEQKGTDILIEAFKTIRASRDDVVLVVAGPAQQFGNQNPNSLTEAIRGVGGIYLGAVDEAQLAPLYNMADVFVLPTRTLEMFGMVAIEAQACGKPVVVSDHGGLKEVVPEGSGFRFPVGDHKALAGKITLLLDDPVLYRSMSVEALKNAQKYDWDVIAADLRNVYNGSFHN